MVRFNRVIRIFWFFLLLQSFFIIADIEIDKFPVREKSIFTRIANKCTAFIRHKLLINPSSLPDATLCLQNLAHEAQTAFGIASRDQVLVKCCNEMPLSSALMIAEPDAIYVDEEYIKKSRISYGVIRFSMYHEACHIKYDDISLGIVRFIWLPFFNYLQVWSLYKFQTKWIQDFMNNYGHFYELGSTACIFTALYLHNLNFSAKEKRADQEAAYACACYCCLQEAALARFSIKDEGDEANFHRKKGYLTQEELLSIAEQLKEKNLLCAHHANNK